MTRTTLSKLDQIKSLKEKAYTYDRSKSYYVDLKPIKDTIDLLTKRSFDLYETKKEAGRQQVSNTLASNRTGHLAEMAVLTFFYNLGIEAQAPDIDAYLANQRTLDDKQEPDIIAGGLHFEVKGISSPLDPSFQLIKKHVFKYVKDNTKAVFFVQVDHDTYEAWIYGVAKPSDVLDCNVTELNTRGFECLSARTVSDFLC
jgi:hypothetical protein